MSDPKDTPPLRQEEMQEIHATLQRHESQLASLTETLAGQQAIARETQDQLLQLTRASTRTEDQMNRLVESTAAVVQFHSDVLAFGRMGSRIRAAMGWVAKWIAILVALAALISMGQEWLERLGHALSRIPDELEQQIPQE